MTDSLSYDDYEMTVISQSFEQGFNAFEITREIAGRLFVESSKGIYGI